MLLVQWRRDSLLGDGATVQQMFFDVENYSPQSVYGNSLSRSEYVFVQNPHSNSATSRI